jgi:hypothetical protein
MRNIVMLKKSLATIAVSTLFSLPSFADSNIVSNMSHIGFGYKHAHLKSGAFEPYSEGEYINDEGKTYGGLYLDLGLSVTETLFLEGNADFVTRFSSGIDSWRLGGGVNVPISPVVSAPFSCGVINYWANSDYSSSFSERAGYCKGGLRAQLAKHWMIDASYRHEFLHVAKDTFSVTNVFQFGSVFGFTLGFDYAQRKKPESAFTVGLQFTL